MMMENVRRFYFLLFFFQIDFSVQKRKEFLSNLLMSVQTAEEINSSSSTPVLSKVQQAPSTEHIANGQENASNDEKSTENPSTESNSTNVKNGDESAEVHVNGNAEKAAEVVPTNAEETKTTVPEAEVKDSGEPAVSNSAESAKEELKSSVSAENATTTDENVSATSTTAETTESATPEKKTRVSFRKIDFFFSSIQLVLDTTW